MRRWLPALLIVAVGCAGGDDRGGGPDGRGDWDGSDKRKKRDPVTVVEVAEIGHGDVADSLQASAVVESEAMADLYPNTSGVVMSIHKDEGDPVARGDLLAVLDNVSLDAGAERSRAEVRRLKEQHDQLQQLQARGAVSDRELEDLAYQLETARVSAREASRSHGQTRITAPFDGVVSARQVRVGELATSGKAAFQVVDLDRLRVVTSLPERDVPKVAVGQPARLTSAYHEESWATGRVTRIAPVIDAGTGTFRVTIEIDDQDILRPGQFVSVDLEVDRHRDVLVAPKRAVVWEDGAPVVYLQDEAGPEDEEKHQTEDDPWSQWAGGGWSWGGDDADEEEEEEEKTPWVARRTSVKLGLVDDSWAEITSGLEAGAMVVTVGQSHLRDGARIRVLDAQQEADASATGEPDEDRG